MNEGGERGSTRTQQQVGCEGRGEVGGCDVVSSQENRLRKPGGGAYVRGSSTMGIGS